jgi:hypothetical protein
MANAPRETAKTVIKIEVWTLVFGCKIHDQSAQASNSKRSVSGDATANPSDWCPA